MAVAFVGSSPVALTVKAATITLPVPTGTATGHFMLMHAANTYCIAMTAALTGWVLIDQPAISNGDIAGASWYRVATSADVPTTKTYAPTWTSADTALGCGAISTYSGVDTSFFGATMTLPSNKHGATIASVASTTSPAPPALTVAGTDLVVRNYMVSQDVHATSMAFSPATPPTGWTQRATIMSNVATTGTYNNGFMACDLAAGNDTATMVVNAAGNGGWAIFGIALPALATNPTGGFFSLMQHHEAELTERVVLHLPHRRGRTVARAA